jgi:hypothetical protein
MSFSLGFLSLHKFMVQRSYYSDQAHLTADVVVETCPNPCIRTYHCPDLDFGIWYDSGLSMIVESAGKSRYCIRTDRAVPLLAQDIMLVEGVWNVIVSPGEITVEIGPDTEWGHIERGLVQSFRAFKPD